MIQTTLFKYFTCNNTNEQPKYNKSHLSFKQTKLNHYFKIIPKKKNLVLNYFKPKVKEKKLFDIILVDLQNTDFFKRINCVKKNMYEPDLKYIAISYRWGEEKEQLVKTPDYIAHVTSFDLNHFIWLCYYIKNESDLKEIPYLWIDTISVDQNNHSRKKETVLKMSDIYKSASIILAVPDLHYTYLLKNTANNENFDLIIKYGNRIHQDIYNYKNSSMTYNMEDSTSNSTQYTNDHFHSTVENIMHKKLINENQQLREKIKEMELKKESEELKKIYQFLAYLIYDWSNRAWVISEYQIAKQKYTQYGTPLKYIFTCLLLDVEYFPKVPFFSYTFSNHNNNKDSNTNGRTLMGQYSVDNINRLIHYLKSRFIQRDYIDMMLGSNASRNEDRFYAILPSWDKYNHLIKNKNTISNWKITDMTTVRLKLYEILEDDDLWNKARLLLVSSLDAGKPMLPSFATFYNHHLILTEIDSVYFDRKKHIEYLSKFKDIKEYVQAFEKGNRTIYKENLIDIQYNQQQCSLSIKANKYFILNIQPSTRITKIELSDYSLHNNDSLQLIYIPFFTYDIPGFTNHLPMDNDSFALFSGSLLLGNNDINRWILVEHRMFFSNKGPATCSSEENCIFNIY